MWHGGKDIWKGTPLGDPFPTRFGGRGNVCFVPSLFLQDEGNSSWVLQTLPHSSSSNPSPQGLRHERTCHPGQKLPQDPPLPSSRLGSGRGEAGPVMSLSPSGREGLLSSCPTGGGQGRSLMTLMSTGASSREKRHRQGQRQRETERGRG